MRGKIKLIALDLDGTTLNEDLEVSKRTQFFIESAEKKGYIVCFVTGRSYISSCRYTNIINLSKDPKHYIVCDNGASLVHTDEGVYVYRIQKDYSFWEKAINFFVNTNIGFYFYQDFFPELHTKEKQDPPLTISVGETPYFASRQECVVAAKFDRSAPLSHYTHINRSPPESLCLHVHSFSEIIPFLKSYNFSSSKLILPGIIPQNRFQQIYKELSQEYNLFRSHAQYTELMPKGINKAYGLDNLTKMFGLGAENVLAIGDNNNDLEMLRWAGISFTPANGSQGAKEAAKYTTHLSNDQDAVADIIETFLI